MTQILQTVFSLLYQADKDDHANTTTTLGYHHDGVEFADEVRECVDRHAWKTRKEWKAELLGLENEEDEEDEEEEEDDDDEELEDADEDEEFDGGDEMEGISSELGDD